MVNGSVLRYLCRVSVDTKSSLLLVLLLVDTLVGVEGKEEQGQEQEQEEL